MAAPPPVGLEQMLECLGRKADRLLAAQAAYQIALSFAGANGGRPADFRTAARWARKSAEYLKTANEPKLRNGTALAAIRLDYYGASTTAELRQVTRSLGQYYTTNCAVPPLDEHCAESLKLLGEVERDLSSRGLPRAQASIDAFRRYLSTDAGKVHGPDRASALLDKGTLIAQAPEGALPPDQADEAETALREAAEVFRGDRQQLAQLNLAAFLGTHRSDRTNSLDEAETLLRGLLAQKLGPIYAFNVQRNLGSILFKKQTGNHQTNLSEAITVLDAAYSSVSPRNKTTWIKTGISLALTLEASGIGVPANLERAKKLLEELLAAADSTGVAAEILETLVSVRLHRLAFGKDEDLDAIGAQLTRAQNASAGAPPLTRARLFALSSDYFSVRAKDGDPAALDKSIQDLRQAIELTDRRLAPRLWATFQNNLGNRCNDRKRPELGSCAEQAYSQALTERTAAKMPREHADTLVNLANLQFSQRNWPGASDLYGQAAELSRTSFDPTLGQDVLRFDAARSDRWFERAAYALARTGKILDAIILADEGRLRFLKQRLSSLPDPKPGELREVSFEKRLTGRTIVLMPIVTTAGCVVFAAALKDGQLVLQQVFLDEFDGDRVAHFLEDRWLQTYRSIFEAEQPDSAGDRWNATINEAGDWLGASFFDPLLRTLEGEGLWPRDDVILVVQGELALLPLHVGKEPSGKRLMNAASVLYLPSLVLWQPRTAEASTPPKLYSIADPSDDSGLPYAPTEAQVSAVLGGVTLAGPVDKGQFLQALEQADILHFVGHARFDADAPERSSIRLSSKDRLEVRDIETAQIRKSPDLIVLSACETGRVETATMANEFVGLPAAFMSIGAKGAVSSLWPASDGPTLFLMTRLMRELYSGKLPSRALQDAQVWLSNSTGSQLADVLRTLGPAPGSDAAKLEQILRIRFRDSRPYAEPWAWAGFVYTGFKP
ncbi:CHAT domain-containing protein [Bradyrhizobium sp. CCGB12]|uniref:CHAT domain-containing protein n=1 Tax=Bradyrhizobium sp. CCGB12 TaxID=2949632 RepID=UPI0020B3101C|nr:CHAT domain-containing protein [Bradyrhizobium sp. CCGB12]MCP3392016.1 CHAT domain-containing protein [Bradyrhizobium sp. CCGB12]